MLEGLDIFIVLERVAALFASFSEIFFHLSLVTCLATVRSYLSRKYKLMKIFIYLCDYCIVLTNFRIKAFLPNLVTDTIFCADSNLNQDETGTCNGDSGGPAMIRYREYNCQAKSLCSKSQVQIKRQKDFGLHLNP